MTHAEQQALLVHYPSGGFGHFLNGLLTTCTDGIFFRPSNNVTFSSSGDSHALELSVAKWMGYAEDFEFVVSDWATESDLCHILLVDSFIENDDPTILRQRFPGNQVIRLCIDYRAVPIVHQTCEFKAMGKTPEDDYSALPDWEHREMITLRYHYADQHDDFYLRKFSPINDEKTLNLPISWIAYNFDQLIEHLQKFLNVTFDGNRVAELYQTFLKANEKYFTGPVWAERILHSLRSGTNIDLSECTSLFDQGYVNYRIEREFNLSEIPPYTYKDWFTDTNSIRRMLGLLR